jgi:hypothetical protein
MKQRSITNEKNATAAPISLAHESRLQLTTATSDEFPVLISPVTDPQAATIGPDNVTPIRPVDARVSRAESATAVAAPAVRSLGASQRAARLKNMGLLAVGNSR